MEEIFWKDGSYDAQGGIYIRNDLFKFFDKLKDKGYNPVGIKLDGTWNLEIIVEKKPNSDIQTNGASQEKPDSSTSDGKQNNSSNSGEQQQLTGELPEKIKKLIETIWWHGHGCGCTNQRDYHDAGTTERIKIAGQDFDSRKTDWEEELKKAWLEKVEPDWQQLKNQEVEPGQQTSNQRIVEGL